MERSFKLRLVSTLSLTLGALLVIAIGVVYLGSDISKGANLISETNRKSLEARNATDNLVKLKEQEKEADIALFKLNNALPKTNSLFSVRRDLEDLAKNRNLSFGSKFGGEIRATESNPGRIEINMNASGNYNDLVAFIRDIETGSYSINLTSFDIVRQGNNFSASLNGEVFFSN